MKFKKSFFVPSFFKICLVAVTAAGDPHHLDEEFLQNTTMTMSHSLAISFRGEVKQNLEKLFGVNHEHLKRQDKFAEITEMLQETYRILSCEETILKKEKEAGIPSQDNINVKTLYQNWKKLEKSLKNSTNMDESAVKASEQTHDKCKEETLSKLQSMVDKLIAAKVDLFEKIQSADSFRRTILNITAQSWIDEKNDLLDEIIHYLDMYAWRTAKKVATKEGTGKLMKSHDPKKLQEYLTEKFNENMKFLVEKCEQQIHGETGEHDDDNISKIRQEIVHHRIQLRKQQNSLDDAQYSIKKRKLSESPLQRENAVMDLIDTILKRDPKSLKKRFAGKVLNKAQMLRDIITDSSACRFTKNAKTDLDLMNGVSISARRLRGEVLMLLEHPPSLTRDLVSKRIKTVTEKHQRHFQKTMDYFSNMEQCAETLGRIDDTLRKIDQWKKKI